MTFETARALVANDLPLSTRLSSVAAYLLVWGYRQQRTRLWRWRNALRRALVRSRPAVRA